MPKGWSCEVGLLQEGAYTSKNTRCPSVRRQSGVDIFQAVAESPQFSKLFRSKEWWCDEGVVGNLDGYRRCGVEGNLTFIFTIVSDVGSSFFTLNPLSQYFKCHQ